MSEDFSIEVLGDLSEIAVQLGSNWTLTFYACDPQLHDASLAFRQTMDCTVSRDYEKQVAPQLKKEGQRQQ